MTKTQNYNLNKPEVTDPLRLADFNENADKIDAALNSLNTAVGSKAEQSAVTALSRKCDAAYSAGNLPWETGTLDLTDADSGDVAKTFDFEPSAILVGARTISPGFGINGGTFRMDEYSSSSRYYFLLSGNELIATTISGAPTAELYYLALK